MLKNIQKYLLLNYPLIWNIKLFPVLLIAILGNILLFLLGYVTEKVDFQEYQYNISENYFLIYFAITILIILFIIIWLVNYSKNNAINSYYPITANKLFLEWILIFVSAFSIFLFPYSFDRGSNLKIRSYASIEEVNKAMEVLSVVRILMPTADSKLDYFREKPNEAMSYRQPNMAMKNPNEMETYNYNLDIDSLFNETQVYHDPDFPNFRQFSLLNYYSTSYSSYLYSGEEENVSDYKRNYDTVKKWLVTGQTDSIKQLMNEYLTLEKKNGFDSEITVDKWFSKIYNFPTFEITDSNLFTLNSYYGINKDSFSINYLDGAYNRIDSAYENNGFILFLWMLNISLGISMLIFSFRVTSGKAWLISMIFIGLISLVFTLTTAFFGIFVSIFEPLNTFNVLVVLLFIVEFIIIANSKTKGKTSVLINHIINLLPIVPLVILGTIAYNLSYEDRSYIEDNITAFVVGNVLLTFVTMYLLIKFQIIRWKGLPED